MSESVRPSGTYRTLAEQWEVLTFPVTAILGLALLPMPVMARLVGLV
jgi:hypothetical protein